jgi:hypothetical protein
MCRNLVILSIGLALTLAFPVQALHAQATKKQPAPVPKQPAGPAKKPAAVGAKLEVRQAPQGYQTIPQMMAARGKAQVALRADEITDTERKDVEDYWTKVVAIQITDPARLPLFGNPDTRNPIGRENIRKDMANAKPGILPFANDVAFKSMSEVASGNFHPAGRVNAMLIIGELDQQPRAQAGGMIVAAVPFAPALTQPGGLIAAVEDPKQHLAVRIAALVGIARHAEAALPAASQAAIRAALVKALKEQPATPADADGNAWFRMRAASILGSLKGGPGPEAPKELATLASDRKAGAVARCAAATALGQIALPADVNAAQLAGGLGTLTLDACRQEMARAAGEAEPIASQKLEQQLAAAVKGLAGLAKSVKDAAAKAIVEDVAAKVGEVHTLFADGAAVEAAGLNEKLAELTKSLQAHKLIAADAPKAADTAAPADTTADTGEKTTPVKEAAAKTKAASTK